MSEQIGASPKSTAQLRIELTCDELEKKVTFDVNNAYLTALHCGDACTAIAAILELTKRGDYGKALQGLHDRLRA